MKIDGKRMEQGGREVVAEQVVEVKVEGEAILPQPDNHLDCPEG